MGYILFPLLEKGKPPRTLPNPVGKSDACLPNCPSYLMIACALINKMNATQFLLDFHRYLTRVTAVSPFYLSQPDQLRSSNPALKDSCWASTFRLVNHIYFQLDVRCALLPWSYPLLYAEEPLKGAACPASHVYQVNLTLPLGAALQVTSEVSTTSAILIGKDVLIPALLISSRAVAISSYSRFLRAFFASTVKSVYNHGSRSRLRVSAHLFFDRERRVPSANKPTRILRRARWLIEDWFAYRFH